MPTDQPHFLIERQLELERKDRRILYLGIQQHKEVIDTMRKSKILIIPSHSEGVAKAMLEASNIAFATPSE